MMSKKRSVAAHAVIVKALAVSMLGGFASGAWAQTKGQEATAEKKAVIAQEQQQPTKAPVMAQQPVAGQPGVPQPGLQTPQAAPPLTFETIHHDWGRIPDTQPVSFTFRFTNTSGETVTLRQPSSTCGCTVPQLTKLVYAPGESGEIVAQFNPQGRVGKQSKGVNITFENNKFPMQSLTLASDIRPWVWTDTPKVAMPEVRRGHGASQTIYVNARIPEFAVTQLVGGDTNFSYTLGEREVVEQEGEQVYRYPIVVAANPDIAIGNAIGRVTVHTNESRAQPLAITTQAIVVGELRAQPASMLVRINTPSTPFEVATTLDTRSNKAFEISSVEVIEGPAAMSLVADFEPSVTNDGHPSYTIKLFGATMSVPGQSRGTVLVRAMIDGEEEELRLPFWSTVANMPGAARPQAAQPAAIRSNENTLQLQPVQGPALPVAPGR